MRKIFPGVVKFIATFFYTGYFPMIPGTFASFVALFLYLLIKGNTTLFFSTTAILILLGFIVAGRAEDILGRKDDKRIVIDEASGMLLVFIGLKQPLYFSPLAYYALAFLIFRFFDVSKVPPLCWIERLPRSKGVMLDDLFAAIYTNITLRLMFLIIGVRS